MAPEEGDFFRDNNNGDFLEIIGPFDGIHWPARRHERDNVVINWIVTTAALDSYYTAITLDEEGQ